MCLVGGPRTRNKLELSLLLVKSFKLSFSSQLRILIAGLSSGEHQENLFDLYLPLCYFTFNRLVQNCRYFQYFPGERIQFRCSTGLEMDLAVLHDQIGIAKYFQTFIFPIVFLSLPLSFKHTLAGDVSLHIKNVLRLSWA